jgi:hypothetical protein
MMARGGLPPALPRDFFLEATAKSAPQPSATEKASRKAMKAKQKASRKAMEAKLESMGVLAILKALKYEQKSSDFYRKFKHLTLTKDMPEFAELRQRLEKKLKERKE